MSQAKRKATRPTAGNKAEAAVFDPRRPFSEGVRGQESFYIQDGSRFDPVNYEHLGAIDG